MEMSKLESNRNVGRTRRRHEAIYTAIRQRISLLDYQPGQRLSEEVLAEEFGISRTPLRRVLAILESEGLVRSVQSVGTIVTDIDIATLTQVYKLRMELAELMGRIDPAPVTESIIASLQAILARFDALGPSPETRVFAQINIDFFHAIVALTENEPLREISERLYYQTARIWIKSIDRIDLTEEISIFRREVSDILAAVELGDLESVGHIRRAHISMSFHRLKARERNASR
jgi:DNA-binding GntR family transcriptional regulator